MVIITKSITSAIITHAVVATICIGTVVLTSSIGGGTLINICNDSYSNALKAQRSINCMIYITIPTLYNCIPSNM